MSSFHVNFMMRADEASRFRSLLNNDLYIPSINIDQSACTVAGCKLCIRVFHFGNFFLNLTYLNSMNIFTLQMADIGAKKLDLCVLSPRKMDQSGKSLKFLKNFSTCWLIAQLSDVTASQDRLQMKAETKTFLTHPLRALKNVYLIN